MEGSVVWGQARMTFGSFNFICFWLTQGHLSALSVKPCQTLCYPPLSWNTARHCSRLCSKVHPLHSLCKQADLFVLMAVLYTLISSVFLVIFIELTALLVGVPISLRDCDIRGDSVHS